MATVALIVWRTLIVGSRIIAFVLFALLFKSWLFVIIGFHYWIMFAVVFYQLRLSKEHLLSRVIYNVITPFVYVFDFCVSWLEGPSRYWYLMCYVPMYCENLLMSALGLWYVTNTLNPAWYILPGCVCVVVMFPLGVLAQLAYYRYWHPTAPVIRRTIDPTSFQEDERSQTTWLHLAVWSEFKTEVIEANKT